MFRDAVAISIAQQCNTVRADASGLRPLHCRDNGVIERRPNAAGRCHRFRHQHIAARQNLYPARMVETCGEGVDLQPRRSLRRPPRCETLRRWHFKRHDALRLRLRHLGLSTDGGRICCGAKPAHQDGGAANNCDALGDDV